MQSKRSPSPISVHTTSYSEVPIASSFFREKSFSLRVCVQDIEKNIAEELQKIKFHPEFGRQERFMVYKHAFDQLVENKAVVCKSLLSQIKAEFEDCIDTLEKGQSQTVYLQGMLKALLSEKSNVRHFVQRGDELEEKIAKLREYNTRLKGRIHALRTARAQRIASAESKSLHSVAKETRLLIPGMCLRDLTNLTSLKKALIKLEAQVNELKEATKIKFSEKSQKPLLKQQLAKKENVREHVLKYHEKLQERYETLKVAVEAARSSIEDPDKDIHVIEVIFKALTSYGKSRYGNKSGSLQFFVSFDEDDPLKKKEAERMIEYVDHFNNLFDFGHYESAAIHAANSPMGILRTYETMIKFKQVDVKEGLMSPLLTFCDALMATASAAQPLTGAMSSECIRCALKEGRLDLATHWLAQGKLTDSIPLGDALREYCKCGHKCTCTCLPLAQTIYAKVGAHHQVVSCLCQQEKYSIMLNYAKKYGEFTTGDYRAILLGHPSPELAWLMLTSSSTDGKKGLLSFVSVVGTLLDDKQRDMLLNFLRHFSKIGSANLSAVMKDALFNETKSDNMSVEKWLRVVDMCQEAGLLDIGVEILSMLTIRDALNKATIAFSMDYIS